MKIGTRTALFGEKLGNALAGNSNSKVSEKDFAPNLYAISDTKKRDQYITTYIKALSEHYYPDDPHYSLCRRLTKRLKEELILHKKTPSKLIKTTNKAIALFNKKFGKHPEGNCRLPNLSKQARDRKLLDKLFYKCRQNNIKHDPGLVKKSIEGKRQKITGHNTFAYPENRVAHLNASHVEIKDKVNFILSGSPRDTQEIADHLYHAVIASDCPLWFTLNECIDRPKFWSNKYLHKLKLPKNWKISTIREKIIDKDHVKSFAGKKQLTAKLVKSTLVATNGKITKKIIHYHYMNWLDHEPAPSEKLLVTCAKIAVKELKKTGKPIGINCKGGSGRTGLLANLIYGMRDIDQKIAKNKRADTLSINIAELNYDLKRKRRDQVSHSSQFAQLYKVLGRYAQRLI